MTPKIDSGDQVKVINCSIYAYRVGDIVYAKVSGNYFLHLLTAIDTSNGQGYDARYQISNNHGHVNGWTDAKNIFGICVQVKDKILITNEELVKRNKKYTREEAIAWSQEEDPETPDILAGVPLLDKG